MLKLTRGRRRVSLGSRLEAELISFWREALKVLEDALLWVGEGEQKVLTLRRRQQLHQTLQLMDTDVLCH